jgi:hypothetical protein
MCLPTLREADVHELAHQLGCKSPGICVFSIGTNASYPYEVWLPDVRLIFSSPVGVC